MKPMKPSQPLALAWYARADWERVRDAAVDPQNLDASFDAWELEALQAECDFVARGFDVRRVAIAADALIAWCRANRRPLDRGSRSAYAQHLLKRQRRGA